MHLSDEELLCLAELTEAGQPYDDRQLLQMEHLKTCGICYDKFCSMLALAEAVGPDGYLTLAELHASEEENVNDMQNLHTSAVMKIRKSRAGSIADIANNIQQKTENLLVKRIDNVYKSMKKEDMSRTRHRERD